MNHSEQIVKAPDNAWITQDGWEDRDCFIGNRPAFETLRNAIDHLLSDDTAEVLIDGNEFQIACIKLQEEQQPIPATTPGERILLCCLASFVGFSLLLGLAALVAIVASLLS